MGVTQSFMGIFGISIFKFENIALSPLKLGYSFFFNSNFLTISLSIFIFDILRAILFCTVIINVAASLLLLVPITAAILHSDQFAVFNFEPRHQNQYDDRVQLSNLPKPRVLPLLPNYGRIAAIP